MHAALEGRPAGSDGAETAEGSANSSAYCTALVAVIRHRRLAHHVHLVNHVRLHQVVMRVLGRLVDDAVLWERDLYFTALALIYLKRQTPSAVLDARPNGKERRVRQASGRQDRRCAQRHPRRRDQARARPPVG